MGFMANWFSGKQDSPLAVVPALLPTLPAHDGDQDAELEMGRASDRELQRALQALGTVGTLGTLGTLGTVGTLGTGLAPSGNPIRDFTLKPTIDPSELSKIMPRDGECSMAVSGLDGVLTIGKDMTMTTDQPIYCQTLRVLGTLEATVHAHKIVVAAGARVMGSVRANAAEIYGEFDGSLQVRGTLNVYPEATLSGKIRATEISLAKQAKVSGADIKRVVPKVLDGFEQSPVSEARFEDGYSSMSITVSQRSAVRS